MNYLNHSSTRNSLLLCIGIILCAAIVWRPGARAAESAVVVPVATTTLPAPSDTSPRTAVLAGGCFWGMELVFAHVDGVLNVVSGYAGGSAETAHYWTVARGNTKQAESVRITYDPTQIRYTQLLRIYFSVAHDPTQVNRQGPDTGTQYRSEIFAANAGQARLARAYIQQLDNAGVFDAPIATEVSRLHGFYPAEAHHQNYAARNPNSRYIQTFDMPKLRALQASFEQIYRQRSARRVASGE